MNGRRKKRILNPVFAAAAARFFQAGKRKEKETPAAPAGGQGGGAPEADAPAGSLRRVLTRAAVVAGFLAIFLAGITVLCYPWLSNYINQKNQSRAIDSYASAVANLSPEDYSASLEAAHAYNAKLAASGLTVHDAFTSGAQDQEDRGGDYWNLLNVDGDSIIGYIKIKKIGLELPIYHGTDEAVLAMGVGHIQGSSLPVGGPDTHAVLSAHTGLPSAKLFTDIDQLAVGDTFTIRVLNETMTYQVDQILTVLPDEIDALSIIPGGDYVTLVTCTPYGINSHRLLVRGTRIATPAGEAETEEQNTAGTGKKENGLQKLMQKIFVAFANVFELVVTWLVKTAERVMDLFGIEY